MTKNFPGLAVFIAVGPFIAAGLLVTQISYADTNPAYSHDADQKTTNRDWMGYMQDSVRLDQLSIPGTHDSMTYGYYSGIGLGQFAEQLLRGQVVPIDPTPIPFDSVGSQTMSLQTQLNSGIRMIDIRCKAINNQFFIYHGDFFVGASFSDVLNTVTAFLASHPREAVLMRVTNELAGFPLNIVPDSINSLLSFEQIFATYWYNPSWNKYFFNPVVTSDAGPSGNPNINPTLGDIRGKIVVLPQFTATQRWGIPYTSFNIQDNYSLNWQWDLYTKWTDVKQQLANSANGPSTTSYMNYLSAVVNSWPFPYFVASGQSSPGTNAPRLWTGLVSDTLTRVNTNVYPDFPRLNCLYTYFDNTCSIYYEGTNGLTESYLHNVNSSNRVSRTGIVLGDFPGPALIDRIITQNSMNLQIGTTFQKGQLPVPDGLGVVSCLGRPGTNFTLAVNGWEHLVWQADGNLVIYDEKGPRWASNTNSPTVSQLCWQGDGNLVIYDPAKPRGVGFATNTDGSGAFLSFQGDCNLVIYDQYSRPKWASNTDPCRR
jgi:1-phosphatidylinositol phosphodiesterase